MRVLPIYFNLPLTKLFLVLILFAYLMPECAPGCPDRSKFESGRALSAHQKRCKFWKEYDSRMVDLRNQRKHSAGKGAMKKTSASTFGQMKSRIYNKGSQTAVGDPEFIDADAGDPMDTGSPSTSQDHPPIPPTSQVSEAGPSMSQILQSEPSLSPLKESLVARYVDIPPQPVPVTSEAASGSSSALETVTNMFGLRRLYITPPTFDPELELQADSPPPSPSPSSGSLSQSSPYSNKSAELFCTWQSTGSELKSNAEMDRLNHDVIQHPEFNPKDLKGFNATREHQRAAKADAAANPLSVFTETSVDIEVPSGSSSIAPQRFAVSGLHYRGLIPLIRSAFNSKLASQFHYSPFKLFHTKPDGTSQRAYSELYNSDAFINEHRQIQNAAVPPETPNCKLEKVVAAIMFWSDATLLANFGNAKLWPIYMFLGNLSKYDRAHPTSEACHHVAYIPFLPDSLQDALATFHTKWSTQKSKILTHCRRELYHAVLRFLLEDPEFQHAYKYGIVIRCYDGIERRVYPRIFTYSADYPEKYIQVLLASIRDKGLRPCPRCLVGKEDLHRMGLKTDMATRTNKPRTTMLDTVRKARSWIYEKGKTLAGKAVEALLKPFSLTPTVNAFSAALGDNFDIHTCLVVDLLHEFELGVWKTVFTHLLRILQAAEKSGELVTELDYRYRRVPTFGNTIRKFSDNVSSMSRLAARDFEDILQCAIPVFEGLLEEPFNRQLMTVLYRLAEWHALAKLRLHTEETLNHLEALTTELGRIVRKFDALTKKRFSTFELPKEAEGRSRRQRDNGKGKSAAAGGRRAKFLNLLTYKWHALADYVRAIRLFGGTDGFSTQVGELAHRLVKRLYKLTNKRGAAKQIASRVRRIEKVKTSLRRYLLGKKAKAASLAAPEPDVAKTESNSHYSISPSKNKPIDIVGFIKANKSDPALKGFYRNLTEHLLGRMLGREFDGDSYGEFSPDERNSLTIHREKMYSVQTCRFYYTSYDVQRESDLINPRTQPFVMVRAAPRDSDDNATASEASDRFWYAQVLGIYRASARTTHVDVAPDRSTGNFSFLWVRWLGNEQRYRPGFKQARLPKVGYVPETDQSAFGFLDPGLVIRGSHLIPAFSLGRTQDLLRTEATLGRQAGETQDWLNFYVDIFVDRDMVMRYFGGGVGHTRNSLRTQAVNTDSDSNAMDSDIPAEESDLEDPGEAPAMRSADSERIAASGGSDNSGSVVDDENGGGDDVPESRSEDGEELDEDDEEPDSDEDEEDTDEDEDDPDEDDESEDQWDGYGTP